MWVLIGKTAFSGEIGSIHLERLKNRKKYQAPMEKKTFPLKLEK
jgi:hypothetical protein